jgi:hypothetical protein
MRNLELRVGATFTSVWSAIVASTRALIQNGELKSISYGLVEAPHFRPGQAACRSGWTNSSGEESFISVHISNTGDDILLAKHCLYGGFSFVKELAKKTRSETRLKRLEIGRASCRERVFGLV